MSKERLGTSVIAVLVGLLVAFVLIPEPGPEIPAGTYVLVEGTIDGIDMNPGLTIDVSDEGISGRTGVNTFYPDGFMTAAGRVPPLEWNEKHFVYTVQGDAVVNEPQVTFTSPWGSLVYERQS